MALLLALVGGFFMKLLFALVITVLNIHFTMAEDAQNKKFGGKINEESTLQLNQVLDHFDKYKNKTVLIEAKVEKVCEQKGCWMVLTDGKNTIRTMFKDYGFFVPKEILNKKVKAQGIMEQKEISVATQKHFMKDAGAKAQDIKKITSSKMEYQFTADAVEII
jgi:hypothetical protein